MKRAERVLAHHAMHDEVTGLPNRRLLMDRMRRSLLRLRRRPGAVALFFVDLDRFKQVNDEYGHDRGDKVLATVAERLNGIARSQDTVARLPTGGPNSQAVLVAYSRAERAVPAARTSLAPAGRRTEPAVRTVKTHLSLTEQRWKALAKRVGNRS
ncbi:MAG: GGDEF domain-containing protein [Actinomycetales bacterium]|nr:GGDEF domain-containing protein [Actinomycetales bacterium]